MSNNTLIDKNIGHNLGLAYLSDIVAGSGIQSVVSGTDISVDNTDPLNPIVNLNISPILSLTAGTDISITAGQNPTISYVGANIQSFAQFFSTQNQPSLTPTANQPYTLTYDNTFVNTGSYTYDVNGYITVPSNGIYKILTSVQFSNLRGNGNGVNIWINFDGTKEPYTNRKVILDSGHSETITVEWFYNFQTTTAFSIGFLSETGDAYCSAFPDVIGGQPATPSIITSVQRVA